MGSIRVIPPCVWSGTLYRGWRELKLLVRCLENSECFQASGVEGAVGLQAHQSGRRQKRSDQSDSCGKDPACSAGFKDGERDHKPRDSSDF